MEFFFSEKKNSLYHFRLLKLVIYCIVIKSEIIVSCRRLSTTKTPMTRQNIIKNGTHLQDFHHQYIRPKIMYLFCPSLGLPCHYHLQAN